MTLHMETLMIHLMEWYHDEMIEFYWAIKLNNNMAPIKGINMATLITVLVVK